MKVIIKIWQPKWHFRLVRKLQESVRNFQKLKQRKYLIKYYMIQKKICLKILFFMFLANFIFVVSPLKPTQLFT